MCNASIKKRSFMNKEKVDLEKRDSVRSVERAIEILQTFSFEHSSLSLAQICRETDLPKTTVFRLLITLEENGFLAIDSETGCYHLGYEAIKIGAIAQESNDIAKIAKDEMNWISEQTEATCNLYIRDGYERLCIAQVAGSQYVRRYSFLGARHPLYCGAGKLLLAYADKEFQEEYLKNVKLEKFTEHTVTNPQILREELESIRTAGYSVTLGERDASTAMVAVPLIDFRGKAIAGITVSGPVYCFSDENIALYIQKLKAAAGRISLKLGCK